jgi:hypothetical protein
MKRRLCAFLIVFVSSRALNAAFIVADRNLWPNAKVPYRFSSQLGARTKLRAEVEKAISRWNERLQSSTVPASFGPVLRPATGADTHVVVFHHRSEIIEGARCFTEHAGYDPDNSELAVYLSDDCEINVVVHEIGHVLGMLHEHQRCDAKDYIQLTMEGLLDDPSQLLPLCDVPLFDDRGHLTSPSMAGDYDFLSIMHYAPRLKGGCLASNCAPYVLKQKGRELLDPMGIRDESDLLVQKQVSCASSSACISPEDVIELKKAYRIPP